MQVFTDIPVVPVKSVDKHIARGGPIWPDFDRQVAARHCRDLLPVDRRAPAPAKAKPLQRAAVWGGYLDLHFGHMIIEQMTRLPQSLVERPDDLYLFTLPPGETEESLPAWVWQIMDWHGLPRRRVRLIDQPRRVTDLRVASQGEMMGTHVSSEAYIDLLDRNVNARNLVPERSRVVFVPRPGMVAQGMGGHAGEAYLCEVLTQVGVRVIDPSRHSVADQLAVYAGAEALVFCEGSAMHGRMLLGRIAQDLHVLRRRPHRDLCAEQLAPRVANLHYHAAVGHRLGARMASGIVHLNLTSAIYNLEVVFDLFGRLGYDLRPLWDPAAYRAAVAQDLRGWLAHCKTTPEQLLDNLALIARAGFPLDPPGLAPPPTTSPKAPH